jgi:flavin reductase (DIM6/NTAB) family NADH-FMN oxidoreductase RutF
MLGPCRNGSKSHRRVGCPAMILDPAERSAGAVYRFLIGVVVPRPIAFVATRGAGGRANLAPFSYFNAISSRPPLLGVSLNLRAGEPKDTLRNVRATGEFTINVVDESMLERMVQTSGDWPADVNEFELAGFHEAPSQLVGAPRVLESPVNLECRLEREVAFGDTVLVVGEMLRAHVAERVLDEHGHVDPVKLRPVGRLGGDGYTIVREVVHFARPRAARGGG